MDDPKLRTLEHFENNEKSSTLYQKETSCVTEKIESSFYFFSMFPL